MALQGIHKDIVSLPQASDAVQHGVVLSGQSAQGNLPRVVLFQIIGKGAAGEISRKAHLGDATNGDAIGGGHLIKYRQHVVGNHAIHREKRILLDPRALLVSISAGETLIALVQPQRAAGIADQNFQFQRLAI